MSAFSRRSVLFLFAALIGLSASLTASKAQAHAGRIVVRPGGDWERDRRDGWERERRREEEGRREEGRRREEEERRRHEHGWR